MVRGFAIQKRVREHYDRAVELGYEVVGVFLQGSQNYGLDYEGSDIDTKAIVLPSFNDFLLGKSMVSTTYVLENNEHIDIKDIRLMFGNFKKQNINFVEILFTEFYVLNPKYKELYSEIFQHSEKIAHYDNYAAINCMAGMVMEKYKALEHPYPATMDKIEKFGYDPKQLHHILRIDEFMRRFIGGVSYKECLVSMKPDFFVEVKKGYFRLEDARKNAKLYLDLTNKMKDNYREMYAHIVDKEVDDILNDIVLKIIKKYFKELLKED